MYYLGARSKEAIRILAKQATDGKSADSSARQMLGVRLWT
jgi:hypothetical protein